MSAPKRSKKEKLLTTTDAASLAREFPALGNPSGPAPVKVPTLNADGALTGVSEDLGLLHAPDPVGHFMLVALPQIEHRNEQGQAVTAGGIILPEAVTDRERAASVIGVVIAMGPDCYLDPAPKLPDNLPAGVPVTVLAARPRFPSGPWCKIGDTVLMSRYAGKRFTIEGVEFRMLADDEITATIPVGAKVGGL